jgi:hypothetical protein
MLSNLRAVLFIASFALASSVDAQVRAFEVPGRPVMPMMPAPMPAYPTLTMPNLATPNLALPAPAPSFAPAAHAAIAPAEPPAAAIVPACPDRPDCPKPEGEGEGPLSEAAKEILKEFAKCAAEGKPFDQCLEDDPPPPTLSSLSDDERGQLTSCLGSNDLDATQNLWVGASPGCGERDRIIEPRRARTPKRQTGQHEKRNSSACTSCVTTAIAKHASALA